MCALSPSIYWIGLKGMPPSQRQRKFASYPRQHELALALREFDHIKRTLFVINWLFDADMQRRANVDLNQGSVHHTLKITLRISLQGTIRDRTAEGQHNRMAYLYLMAPIIIHWNSNHLGHTVAARKRDDIRL